jgi:hypothetical protein
MSKKINLVLINSLIVLFLIVIFAYIIYKESIFQENFDNNVQKIKGDTVILNGRPNGPSSSPVYAPSSAPAQIKINEPKASYEKNNELPEKVIPTPSEIAATQKIINMTVPKAPKPLDVNLPSYEAPSAQTNNKKAAEVSTIPKEVNPDVPALSSGPVASDPSRLTVKEKQLFDAFLEQRITDDKVHEMIESGVLNEQLVEKFLKLIDDLPEGPSVGHAPKKSTKNFTVDKASKSDNLVEGFMSGGMAKY